MDRRTFLRLSAAGLVASAGATSLGSCVIAPVPTDPGLADYGPLLAADANGLKLPAGFSSRIVATTGQAVADTGYVWHANPDGGACFPAAGGGWIYVSNDESSSPNGGASMVRTKGTGSRVRKRSDTSSHSRHGAAPASPGVSTFTRRPSRRRNSSVSKNVTMR